MGTEIVSKDVSCSRRSNRATGVLVTDRPIVEVELMRASIQDFLRLGHFERKKERRGADCLCYRFSLLAAFRARIVSVYLRPCSDAWEKVVA